MSPALIVYLGTQTPAGELLSPHESCGSKYKALGVAEYFLIDTKEKS